MKTIQELLKDNSYPGRGILIGKSADGRFAVTAYFIMGRSENSCNRVFVKTEDGIRTQAHDPQKLSDPSLVIYAPVRRLGNKLIVTNGDQTDTIYDMMNKQMTFEQALMTRTFEPDPPILTPRISGILKFADGSFNYALSILKSADGNPASSRRFFYCYENPIAGQGHLIHTYAADGNPPESFSGEPRELAVGDDLEEFGAQLWGALNAERKVSLFVRFTELATGQEAELIYNKNEEGTVV